MKFVVEQKFALLTNAYRVFDADQNGTKQDLFAYVQQKRLAMREKVTFYKNETMQTPLFTLRADKRIDIHGKYFIEDESGDLLGYIRREFKTSLLRTTWRLYAPDDTEICAIREQSMALAITRRIGDLIPYIGAVFNMLPYHFEFISNNKIVGSFSRKFTLRDKYLLNYDGDKSVDKRVLAALGVALDVLQSR